MISGFKIKDIADDNINNKRIIIRNDFNVDYDDNYKIIDDFRIVKALPTLNYLLTKNNRLILISHLGKPDKPQKKYSLKPVANRLQQLITDKKIVFVNNFKTISNQIKITNQSKNEIILLENIRYYPEEMSNDIKLARQLVKFADIYVNDAFGESHRNVATINSIATLIPSYAGLLLKSEVEHLNRIFIKPAKPLTFIIGGSKISTKIKFIKKVLSIADYLLIGGEIANTFLSIAGYPIKNDLIQSAGVDIGYDPQIINTVKDIYENKDNINCKIIMPVDGNIAPLSQLNQSKIQTLKNIKLLSDMFDIGPQTINQYIQIINLSKTIVWNGPLGWIEKKQFCSGTKKIYQAIINRAGITSIIGGGDSISFLRKQGNIDRIDHWSIGGGAMLEFIEKGTLQGLEKLKQ